MILKGEQFWLLLCVAAREFLLLHIFCKVNTPGYGNTCFGT
jgi:hypothetical protein